MKTFIRVITTLLIYQGIAYIWEWVDVAMYGMSQRSAMDALATWAMVHWLAEKIWGGTDNA